MMAYIGCLMVSVKVFSAIVNNFLIKVVTLIKLLKKLTVISIR